MTDTAQGEASDASDVAASDVAASDGAGSDGAPSDVAPSDVAAHSDGAGLSDLDWRFVAEETRDGPTNMALDEVAAETAAAGGPATIRLFRWAPSTLSLGYGQDADTVDWDFCEREGVGITRRPTGGGGIYHDNYGDVSYAIVVPADAVPGDLMATYELLCEPILAAFESMGVDAHFADAERAAIHRPACYLRALDPAHDVVGPDGRKLAGNAQHRSKGAVVQHGSLTYSLAPERHCGCFSAKPDPGGFAERVGAIDEYADVDRDEVVATVERALADWAGIGDGDASMGNGDAPIDDGVAQSGDSVATGWSEDELGRAAELVESKYGADPWVRNGEPVDS